MGGSSYIPSWSREQHNSSLGSYNLYDSRSSRKQINSQSRKINELNGTIEDQKATINSQSREINELNGTIEEQKVTINKMNNERSFLFQPIYMYECKNQNWYIRDFKEEELKELDKLADLMLENDKNLEKLYRIYNSQDKYRKLLGISVWN